MDTQIAKLIEFGSDWHKAGATRSYFNNLEELYGLEFEETPAGRVISVKLDGQAIEVNKGLLLRGRLAMAKIWFDYEKVSFHYENLDPVMAQHIIDVIRKQITEASSNG